MLIPMHWKCKLCTFTESDLQEQVEGSLNMPATYETVVARAQLALVCANILKASLNSISHLAWFIFIFLLLRNVSPVANFSEM